VERRRRGLLANLNRQFLRTTPLVRGALFVVLATTSGLVWWSYRESQQLRRDMAMLNQAVLRTEEQRKRLQDRVDEERSRAEAERKSLEAKIEVSHRREAELSRELAEATSGQVKTLKTELLTTRERLALLEVERAVGERIIREYGGGVCLIQ